MIYLVNNRPEAVCHDQIKTSINICHVKTYSGVPGNYMTLGRYKKV
jgi:hypothetical protein